MDDRKLLELAAKAVVLRLTWGEKYRVGDDEVDCTDIPYAVSVDREESPAYCNPLQDDGDALRLAIKLGLLVDVRSGDKTYVAPNVAPLHLLGFIEPHGDPAAATRRAIVRAAAQCLSGAATP